MEKREEHRICVPETGIVHDKIEEQFRIRLSKDAMVTKFKEMGYNIPTMHYINPTAALEFKKTENKTAMDFHVRANCAKDALGGYVVGCHYETSASRDPVRHLIMHFWSKHTHKPGADYVKGKAQLRRDLDKHKQKYELCAT